MKDISLRQEGCFGKFFSKCPSAQRANIKKEPDFCILLRSAEKDQSQYISARE